MLYSLNSKKYYCKYCSDLELCGGFGQDRSLCELADHGLAAAAATNVFQDK